MFRRKQTSQPVVAQSADGRPNAFTILPGVPAPRSSQAEPAPEPEPVVEAPVVHTEPTVLPEPEAQLAPTAQVPVAEPAPVVAAQHVQPSPPAEPAMAFARPTEPPAPAAPLDEPAPHDPPAPAPAAQPPVWNVAVTESEEQASVVAPDPSSPVLDGSFVEPDDEPLRPAVVRPGAATAENQVTPALRRLPELPDYLSEQVASQVAAEYAARQQLADAAPPPVVPAELPTPPLPDALIPMMSRVAAQVAAEHAARRVDALVAPQAQAHQQAQAPEAAQPAQSQAPAVGLVFADGSSADLAESPELAAFQQAAGALTTDRQQPPLQ